MGVILLGMSNVSQHTKLITMRFPNEVVADLDRDRLPGENRTETVLRLIRQGRKAEATPPANGAFW